MKIKKPRKQHAPRSAVKLDAFTRNGGPMRHKNDRRAKEKEAAEKSGSSDSEGPPGICSQPSCERCGEPVPKISPCLPCYLIIEEDKEAKSSEDEDEYE